jgi:beta-1,4-mannosyl-glycoprotein beta-1,4-N-acetylglucosaminyltransferase
MKIFDCFKFFNEYEILELRFMALYDHVDYFVLVESNKTHTGKPKPWNFEERKDQYAQWLDKVIYVKVEDLPDYSVDDIWKAENFQRNCISRGLEGVAQPGDKIFVSDCDEIWNPDTAQLYLGHNQFVVFQQKLFYYFVNCRQNQLWNGTCMATYGSYENPQQLRNYARSHMPIPVLNGGWHYSFMGSAEKIKEKVENIAESHLIIKEVGDVDKIQNNLDNITDLWDRTDSYATKRLVDISTNGPKCLYKFIEKYPSYYKENK